MNEPTPQSKDWSAWQEILKGKYARPVMLFNAGNSIGITNTGEDIAVETEATMLENQIVTYSSPLKKLILSYSQDGVTPAAIGLEVRVVFGAIDLADAKIKLADAALHQKVKFDDVGEFPFPEFGGAYNFAYSVNTVDLNTKLNWEVTL